MLCTLLFVFLLEVTVLIAYSDTFKRVHFPNAFVHSLTSYTVHSIILYLSGTCIKHLRTSYHALASDAILSSESRRTVDQAHATSRPLSGTPWDSASRWDVRIIVLPGQCACIER